jgi:O-antigen/teichoic acid export membrane protein
MSRQALTSLSTALGPEITELFGKNNWPKLLRLYDLSERAVFALVPVVTLGTFLATPALMTLWVHKPALFQFHVCIYMALISAAAGIKEHKYQFQISINRHAEMARFLFFTYIGMVLCMVPAVLWFGISGFLALWLATEIVQIGYIVTLNQRLFKHASDLEMAPLYRIAGVLTVGMAAAWWVAIAMHSQPIVIQLLVAVLFGAALLAAEYPIFGLGILKDRLADRSSRRKLEQEEELNPVV